MDYKEICSKGNPQSFAHIYNAVMICYFLIQSLGIAFPDILAWAALSHFPTYILLEWYMLRDAGSLQKS